MVFLFFGVCVLVCVCPTLEKGSSNTFPHRQGGNARLTDIAQRRRCQLVVKQCGTPHCVPAEFFPQAVTLLFHDLIHGSSCFHPQTGFPTADLQTLCRCALSAVTYENFFVETSTIALTFHLTVEPFLSLGNCVN